MNFMFSWQEQYLTRSLRSLVRYCCCHSNIKFISSRHRVISSIYEQLLEKADLPTLLNRRLQDLCILTYKVKHKLCPAYISNIFKEPNSNYNLRQADFSIPRYETVNYGKHSIRYLGPGLWTKLPKLRDVTTLMSFKGKIRQLNISEFLDDGCAGCSLCSF